MKQKIQISIPEPCQENWQNMSPVDKGRFCSSCQKTVLDFTHLSDNEIIKLVSKNDSLCGRIKASQLNRNLIETKRTSNYFGYLATSVLAFLGLGTQNGFSQEKPKVEQNIIRKSENLDDKFLVRGIVKDSSGVGIRDIYIQFKKQKPVYTNLKGEFEIFVKKNQEIFITNDSNDMYEDFECKISDNSFIEIVLEEAPRKFQTVTMGATTVVTSSCTIYKKQTFFGKTFRKIRNWFR